MKFLAFYWEMLEVKYGVWGEIRASFRRTWVFLGAIWVGLHILLFDPIKGYGRKVGRFWAKSLRGYGRRNGYKFSWWTYYKAVNKRLYEARVAKSLWSSGYISAATCVGVYGRHAPVAARAREKGYVRLASQDIHKKRVFVMAKEKHADFLCNRQA